MTLDELFELRAAQASGERSDASRYLKALAEACEPIARNGSGFLEELEALRAFHQLKSSQARIEIAPGLYVSGADDALTCLRRLLDEVEDPEFDEGQFLGTRACTSCNAPILFVKTATGKILPLEWRAERWWLVDSSGTARAVLVHQTHFASCPDAAKFRRPRAKVQ